MLSETMRNIKPLCAESMEKAQKRLDCLSKPLGSLGRLEGLVKQLAGITGEVFPIVDKKMIVIMCADNGVVAEGVTQVGKEVTASVTCNFSRGITGINALSRHAGADILVVDIGIDTNEAIPGALDRKIGKGTGNIAMGPAMTREQALLAIETGIEIARNLKLRGVNLLGTGEMGIGNTTTSSAVASVLTGNSVEVMVGRGAGLSNEGFNRKIDVVKRALEINSPNEKDAVDVLAKVGGYDLAGLAGVFIGAAECRLPVVIDGFITAAAALAACRMVPAVRDYLLPSHGSAEPGNQKVLESLGLQPYLNLEMRLGEGTGAALAFHVIDAAVYAYTHMGTFNDAQIEQYTPQV